jgi:hypothetical protein
VRTATATAEPVQHASETSGQLVRLVVPRDAAASQIERELKIGKAILNQRIGSLQELSLARSEKQEWIQRTQELLLRLFDNPLIAQKCNDWVPIILPEYADLGLFVDVFVQEMRYRIGRLSAVRKAMDELEDPPPKIDPQTMHPELREQENVEQAMNQQTIETIPPERVEGKPLATAQARHIGGVLVSAGTEPAQCERLMAFFRQLDLPLSVISRDAQSSTPLIDALSHCGEASFALLMGPPQSNSPSYWFDLGCCVGRLGSGRVITLGVGGGGDTPSLVSGLSHIPLDQGDGWQLALARQLRRSGTGIDLNRLA